MLSSTFLDVVSGRDSGRVILGVDFPARRRSASFADLAANMGPGYRFLQAKPSLSRPGRSFSDEGYVAPLADALRKDQGPVRAVIGYSVGSVYAAAIADSISQWQEMPDIILLDPQAANVQLLGHELQAEVSMVSSLLSSKEIEQAASLAVRTSELPAQRTAPMADIADQMMDDYLDVVIAAFERVGLGDARDDGLIVSFASYIAWIVGADQISPGSGWGHSTVIFSSDYARLPAGGLPSGIARRIQSEAPHAELYRSESVAKAVLRILQNRE